MNTQEQETEATTKRDSVVRISTHRKTLLAYEIRMPVAESDFRKMALELETAYAELGHIDLLVRLVGGLRFNLDLLGLPLLKVKRDALKHVDRYAVVGGPSWLEKAVELLNPLFRMEVRQFDADDEADAWEWLRSAGSDA